MFKCTNNKYNFQNVSSNDESNVKLNVIFSFDEALTRTKIK